MRTTATLKLTQKADSPASSLFNQIYEIAKDAKKNPDSKERLSKLLESGACIDIRDNTGRLTPAGKLAKEGNRGAAHFLLEHGASVHHIAAGAARGDDWAFAEELRVRRSANVNLIAQSAASNNNRPYAEKLRERHGANASLIAWGAAYGRDRVYAEYLRKHCGADVTLIAWGAAAGGYRPYAEYLREHFNANVDDIAIGAAMGGDLVYAEELRTRRPRGANINNIAFGAASTGHHTYTEELRGRRPRGADVSKIAQGAAFGGHRAYAEWLRENHGANVHAIAWGAAAGGHCAYAEYLRIHHGANVNVIAAGAAACGHYEYAEELRRNYFANVGEIVESASFAGDSAYAEYLCGAVKADEKRVVKKGNRSLTNPVIALHTLSFIKNNGYRVKLAKAVTDAKLVSHDVMKLVPKAQKIAELMPKYDYSQCLAFGRLDLHIWYLQCAVLVKQGKLAHSIFWSVSRYLSPLTFAQARDLYELLRFDMFRKLLVNEVDRHYVKTQTFHFFGHDKKAEAFSLACAQAKNTKALQKLLEDESKRINDEQHNEGQARPYSDLIARQIRRLA